MVQITIERRHVYFLAGLILAAALFASTASWAADRFTDVADSNPFDDDIAWMADTGITKGCNPPANDRFCPGNYVTREQMAAFMHRFAISQGDGSQSPIRSASAVSPRAYAFPGPMTGKVLVSTSIVAPVDGFLLINANADVWRSGSGPDDYICSIMLNGTTTFGPGAGSVDGSGAWQDTCTALAYEPVAAGSHAVAFKAALVAEGTYFESVLLNVLFVPAN